MYAGFGLRSQALRGVILSSETDETIDHVSNVVDASSVDVVPQTSSESASDVVDEAAPSGTLELIKFFISIFVKSEVHIISAVGNCE